MITLYSTHCPKCKILEKKLNDAKIEYTICDNKELMIQKGFDFMPVLDVDGQIMNFGEAVKWVNNQ
jgi:hypothetical protein